MRKRRIAESDISALLSTITIGFDQRTMLDADSKHEFASECNRKLYSDGTDLAAVEVGVAVAVMKIAGNLLTYARADREALAS